MPIDNVIAGQFIDPDWGNDVANGLNALERTQGTYTPTLSGMAPGTGGSATNTATYVHADGNLKVYGRVLFGTSGASYPSGIVTVTLPAAYQFASFLDTSFTVGDVIWADIGTANYYGRARRQSATTARLTLVTAAGTYPLVDDAPSSTIPFTWVAGDSVLWTLDAQVIPI